MTPEQTIRSLLKPPRLSLEDQVRAASRRSARLAWAQARVAELRAADERVNQAWKRIFDALPEDLDDEQLEAIDEPAEEAEREAIHDQIRAVIEHDRWPRELYWSL